MTESVRQTSNIGGLYFMTSVTSCEELKKEVNFEIHIPKTSKDKIKAHQAGFQIDASGPVSDWLIF